MKGGGGGGEGVYTGECGGHDATGCGGAGLGGCVTTCAAEGGTFCCQCCCLPP